MLSMLLIDNRIHLIICYNKLIYLNYDLHRLRFTMLMRQYMSNYFNTTYLTLGEIDFSSCF